jgi:hypothetical protein
MSMKWSRAYLPLLAVLLASAAQASSPVSTTLTAEEAKALRQLVAAAPPHGESALLDLTNPSQESVFRALMRINGFSPANRPQLFRMVEKIKKNHAALRAKNGSVPVRPATRSVFAAAAVPEDTYLVLNIGTNDWKTIDSTAFSTLYHGSHYSNVMITVQAHDGTVIKKSSAEEWDSGRDMAVESGDGENVSGKEIDSVGMFVGQDSTGTPYGPFYSVASGGYYPKQVNNDKPVVTTTNKSIVVCLNRANPDPSAPTQCDYGPTDPGHMPPDIKFPFKGAVQYFGNIDVDPSTGKPPPGSYSVSLSLTGRTTGGACKLVEAGKSFMDDPNTKINGNTITWDMEPVNFGKVCWANNEYYTLTLALTLSIGGVPVVATITNAPNTKPTVSTLVTKDLQLQYGCIVAGTQITMADGRKLPIEQIKRGDLVLGRDKRPLLVEWRTDGWDANIIRIVDSAGDEVQLTPLHPVPTERGMLQARDLKVGDRVFGAKGKTKIAKLTPEVVPRAVAVHNIGLIDADGKALKNSADATFFAGSLLVGDAALQAELMQSNTKAQPLRTRVPAEWRTDFDNWAKEQKKAKTP